MPGGVRLYGDPARVEADFRIVRRRRTVRDKWRTRGDRPVGARHDEVRMNGTVGSLMPPIVPECPGGRSGSCGGVAQGVSRAAWRRCDGRAPGECRAYGASVRQ